MKIFLWLLTACIVVATALPLLYSDEWWVRMWDFPRLHIAVAAIITLVLAATFSSGHRASMVLILLLCFVYQAVQIFPYTGLAAKEVQYAKSAPKDAQVSFLAINVLMENDRYDDLAAIIKREQPDVLFLMETDQKWASGLEDVLKEFTTVKSHISDDHYGLIFATNLDPEKIELLWPIDDTTPAIHAVLAAPDGTRFNFAGLHPRPPVPGNDTTTRDRQIKQMAEFTASATLPTVCMGDFNDVAWSWTTQRFKRYGNFKEPRVGRGMMSSFNADHWFMRFPIDQLYITANVGLIDFGRLEAFGSDHFPIHATLSFSSNAGDE